MTKFDVEMFHDAYWKSVYFGIERSKVKVTSHINIAGVGLCTLVSAGFFQLNICEVESEHESRCLKCHPSTSAHRK